MALTAPNLPIIVVTDQQSWCCFEIGIGQVVRYLHGPVSGISKGQYGLTAREAIAFAGWGQFDLDGKIPPDDQWPVSQVAIYEPANIFNKFWQNLPVFNGTTRRFAPRASNRPGLRSGSGQGTRSLVRQTDDLPPSLGPEGSQPKRIRLKLDSTIEIELIEQLKADVWLCRLK